MNQALGFALFRTYAVPGIGRLLDETGEFTERPQKRYDDTALLLEPPTRLGFEDPEAKAAIRRINAMHRAYDIPNHEFRYVLSTFVVVPKRWLDDYGKRPLTAERGRGVGAVLPDPRPAHEHQGRPGDLRRLRGADGLLRGRALRVRRGRPPGRRLDAGADGRTSSRRIARPVMGIFSRALMDPPLREAFRYDDPPAAVVAVSRGALKARGLLLRAFPARRDAEADRGPPADPQLPGRLRRRAARHVPGAGRQGLPGRSAAPDPLTTRELSGPYPTSLRACTWKLQMPAFGSPSRRTAGSPRAVRRGPVESSAGALHRSP